MCVCVCVRACVHVCVCVCARACVSAITIGSYFSLKLFLAVVSR